MASYIVKIGKSSSFGARLLDIQSDPDAASFRGNAFLPAAALIPMRQHSGAAARPAILPGTRVREGQVIGLPSRHGSAYVYASVPGILRGYSDVPLPDGSEGSAGIIEISGPFELTGRRSAPRDIAGLSPDTLLSMIEDYGIVSNFEWDFAPLSRLMREFREGEPDAGGAILAVRLFDFDPSCRADSFLAQNRAGAVLEGAALAAKIIGAKRVFLIYPGKKAIPPSEAAPSAFEGFEVKRAVAPSAYPYGAEYFCKKAAANGFGASDAEKSVFCINPWTAFATFNALKYAMPVLQRPVLISGAAIKAPQMLNVRIGTRVRDLVEQCGGFRVPPAQVVAGGLIAGKAIADLDAPIDVNTSSLHFLASSERRFYTAERCIHCGKCLRACPRRLDPVRLAVAAQEREAGAAFSEGDAAMCVFCGACSAVCPAGIPLHHIIRNTIGDFRRPNASASADSSGGDA